MPFYLEETIVILASILLKRLKRILQSQTVKISRGLRVQRRSHNQNRDTFLLKVPTAHEEGSFAIIFLQNLCWTEVTLSTKKVVIVDILNRKIFY